MWRTSMVCMCFFNFEFLICYYSVSRSNYALFPSSNEVLCISKCRIRYMFSLDENNQNPPTIYFPEIYSL